MNHLIKVMTCFVLLTWVTATFATPNRFELKQKYIYNTPDWEINQRAAEAKIWRRAFEYCSDLLPLRVEDLRYEGLDDTYGIALGTFECVNLTTENVSTM